MSDMEEGVLRMTDTATLAQAMFILSKQIQSPDGVANAAILEAAQRLVILDSMCKAAAVEIEEYWESHCDEEGYGPGNLLSRLNGKLPPSIYDAYVPYECRHIVPLPM